MSRERSRSPNGWRDPVPGDRVLVVHRHFAELIVSGEKTLELRSKDIPGCVQSGDVIYIASSQDAHQGRRAYRSPLPDQNPRKSQILGSVRYQDCQSYNIHDLATMHDLHRVEDEETAMKFVSKKDGLIRGWHFFGAVKAPVQREYAFKRGSVVWRIFQGWA